MRQGPEFPSAGARTGLGLSFAGSHACHAWDLGTPVSAGHLRGHKHTATLSQATSGLPVTLFFRHLILFPKISQSQQPLYSSVRLQGSVHGLLPCSSETWSPTSSGVYSRSTDIGSPGLWVGVRESSHPSCAHRKPARPQPLTSCIPLWLPGTHLLVTHEESLLGHGRV